MVLVVMRMFFALRCLDGENIASVDRDKSFLGAGGAVALISTVVLP